MTTPTKYEPSHPARVKRLALLGLTQEDIESAFGIGHATFLAWRDKYPEFDEALHEGRIDADARVAEALFQRATGYKHRIVKLFQHQGEVIEHEVDELHPPDVQAAIKWLHNRKPNLWRAAKEPEDGGDEAPPPTKIVIEVVDGRTRAEPQSAAG